MEKGSYINGAKLPCGRMKTVRVDCLYPTCFGKVGKSVALHRGPEGEATMLKRKVVELDPGQATDSAVA